VAAGVQLLDPDEPPPFEVAGRQGRSPFLIVCDHAGRRLPRALGSLGLSEAALTTHIAWDIGAGGVAQRLAEALDAFMIRQPYSRLAIDCNRPLDAVDSIATLSERMSIPGNQRLPPGAAEARAREIFEPYHRELRGELERRRDAGRAAILVTVHSFTPVFLDLARPWHVGILYNRDARLAEPLLGLLRDEGDLVVGRNQPYAASDLSDFALVQHGEKRGVPCVEIEMRQDLIAGSEGQSAWAERLARLLPIAARGLRADELVQPQPPQPGPTTPCKP
jgi:predicted N-formylglutamate amidohydrolase